jgi:hypothetical protein
MSDDFIVMFAMVTGSIIALVTILPMVIVHL